MNKKILAILLFITMMLLVGCRNMMNTPTGKVESFLDKYQRLDNDVLKELDLIIGKDKNMNDEEKNEYKAILEKQYQNLSYKINNEEIENNIAVVEVEIEVLDYKAAINKTLEYYKNNRDEFIDDENKNDDETNHKYIDYKLKELRQVNSKVKYDLTFQLQKEDGIWQITSFTDTDRKKIHGLY